MKHFLAVISLVISLQAIAEQKLYINGELVETKVVTEMTFAGNDVTLTYEGGTTETLDISAVVLEFQKSQATTGLNNLQVAKTHTIVGNELTICGTTNGDVVDIFNLQGAKVATQKANSNTTTISVGELQSGLYLLRTSNYIVKFVKK